MVALALLVAIASPQRAQAGGSDSRRDAEVNPEAQATGSGVTAAVDVVFVPGESVNLGPDPFADCDVLTDLTRSQLANLNGTSTPDNPTTTPSDAPDGAVPTNEAAAEAGTLYTLVFCNAALVRFWQQGEPVPAEILDILVASARSRTPIVPPTPTLSPAGTPDRPLLTQLPTWVWLDDTIWTAATATAAIPELPVTVTVTAAPRTLTWDPGDGTPPISCGQGTPWSAGADDAPPPDEACVHTYTATAGLLGAEPVVATTSVDYAVTATCTPAPQCANLNQPGDVTISTETALTITEVRGLITG